MCIVEENEKSVIYLVFKLYFLLLLDIDTYKWLSKLIHANTLS